MRQRGIGQDTELTMRMFLTMFLLAAVYLGFLAFLFSIGFDYVFLITIGVILAAIQYFYSDRMVLKVMGARIVSPQEAPELHAMIERLAAQADLPKPKVAVADKEMPNAFATGRNPSNAVIAVTTGIVNRLQPHELEAVLAHELTHIKNRDVMVMTLASFFSMVLAFIMQMAMFRSIFGGYGYGRRDGGGSAIFLVYLASLLAYYVSYLLILTLSRYREFAADRGGAVLTGAPSHLASALMKISGVMQRIPQQDLRQAEKMNAFFIVPALSGGSLAGLFSTHPALEQRLERLRRMEQEMEGR